MAHGGAGSVPGEESSVDPGEVGHITQAVSVLGPDVVPVPGIQVGRGVAHVGGANDESFFALLGPAQQDMAAGHGAVIGRGPSEGDRAVLELRLAVSPGPACARRSVIRCPAVPVTPV